MCAVFLIFFLFLHRGIKKIRTQNQHLKALSLDADLIIKNYIKIAQGEHIPAFALESEQIKPLEGSRNTRSRLQNIIAEQFKKINTELKEDHLLKCSRVFYVGGDTFFEGYVAGKEIDTFLKKEGKIAIISGTFSNLQIRLRGVRSALKEYQSLIEIVDVGFCQHQNDLSYAYTKSFIERYKNLNLIYVSEGNSVGSVIKAIKDEKKEHQIKVVCHDLNPDIVKAFKEEIIVCSVVQDPQAQGYETPIHLYNYLLGNKKYESKRILTENIIVDKNNYHVFWDENLNSLQLDLEKINEVKAEYTSKEPIKIAFITPNNSLFWIPVFESASLAKKYLKKYNCELTIIEENFYDLEKIKLLINKIVADGFSGVCTPIFEPQVIPLFNELSSQGIAIATYNSELSPQENEQKEDISKNFDYLISLSAQDALRKEMQKKYKKEKDLRVFAEALMVLGQKLNQVTNTNEVFRLLLEEIYNVFNFDSGAVFLVNQNDVEILYTTGYDEVSKEVELYMNTTEFNFSDFNTYKQILKTKELLLIPDTAQSPLWVVVPGTAYIKSWIGCPIIIEDVVVAIFTLDKDEANFFTQEQVQKFKAFSVQVALALKNVKLVSELSALATTDPLTGLANRRSFDQSFNNEQERAMRYGTDISLLYMDLDNFKKVNDLYGHAAGDEIIKAFAKNLRNSLRMSDIAARYGGEEFIIAAPQSNLEAAVDLAERIRKKMELTYINKDSQMINTTVSIGVTNTNGRNVDFPVLFTEADKALYRAKKSGRNKVISSKLE